MIMDKLIPCHCLLTLFLFLIPVTCILKYKMTRVLYCFLLGSLAVVLLIDTANAESINFFGYLRSELRASDANPSDILFMNKLRLDFKSVLSSNLFIGGNVNLLVYQGDNYGNFLNNMPDSIERSVDSASRYLFDYSLENDLTWDNLFIKYIFSEFDVTIGKQQISFGSGYAWNPTDLFNVKNLVDPTDEKKGHKALRIDYPLSLSQRIMFLYDIEDSTHEPGMLLCYKTTLGHFDYSLIFGRRYCSFTDYENFSGTREKRKIIGFDMAGEVFGLGFWFEGAYNWLERNANYYEFVIGGDYTWRNGFYLLMEYFHSSPGNKNSSDYDLNSWMRFFTGEAKAISKDNLYLYGYYPVTDLMNIGISVISSLSDGSVALIPVIDYSLANDLYLEIFGGINLGKDDTVYSGELGKGLLMRLTWYF